MRNLDFSFKTLLLAAVFFMAADALLAQSSLTIDASQAYTTFAFTDSEGNDLNEYSGNYSGSYSIGYQYTNGFMLRANIGMRKAGATTVIDETNYSWDFQYADVKLGIGYMFGESRFRPYILISPYYAVLLKAEQTINNEDFDIKDLGLIADNDYGVFASPGVQITLSEFISAYTQFNYMYGLQNLESDDTGQESFNNNNTGQESYNRSYSLSLGLSFSIK